MCGLTGFARHPEAPGLEALTLMFYDLMGNMGHRGRHATGVSINQNEKVEVYKWAAPVETVVKSDPWHEAMARVTAETTVVQGHVRHATHQNANDPEAAHPFQIGRIVGAHNGIIYNWREVESKLRKDFDIKYPALIVDSEVALLALDMIKDPVRATDMLDGYWALTWTKGRSLFLCRTQNAPLTCAYIGKWKALVWHSERSVLMRVLQSAGAGTDEGFDVWDVKPGTIYRYVPNTFTEKQSKVEKRDAPFRGRKEHNVKFNSAHPNESQTTTWSYRDARGSNGGKGNWRGGGGAYGGGWDYETARETANKFTSNSGGQVSLTELKRTIGLLADRVQALEMEQDLIIRVIEEAGFFEPGEVRKVVADKIAEKREAEQPQQKLPLHNPPIPLPPNGAAVLCAECNQPWGGAKGRLVSIGEGKFVHECCIFPEEQDDTTPPTSANSEPNDSDATGWMN